MVFPVWLQNLISYSLQIAVLASAGTLLIYLFRLRMPRLTHLYWQTLLGVCLLTPLVQDWQHPAISPPQAAVGTVSPIVPIDRAPSIPEQAFRFPAEAVGLAIVAGACLRLMWLAIGFLRLRRLRSGSRFYGTDSALLTDVQLRTGSRASIRISDEVNSPVTFGFRAPTIILPGTFEEMSESCRKSILCHELLHVRRKDWVLVVIEEIVCSVFWFHPAVWWLLGRIRLSREQVVDHDAVRLTGSAQPYLDSLLEIARTRGRPRAVPAPLFLREHHFIQRVALLLKEATMSRSRMIVSLSSMAVLMMFTVRLAAAWFPLTGAPVIAQPETAYAEIAAQQTEPAPQAIRTGSKAMEPKLVRKVEPVYPELARRARVQGTVILQVIVDKEGFVTDTRVLYGQPLLSEAAIAAVKQWRYSPTLLNGKAVPVTATVTVVFNLKGDEVESAGGTSGAVPGVVVGVTASPEPSVDVHNNAPGKAPIRVGNNVMESRLVRRVEPVYPELAKRARVQGPVILQVTVDEAGFVTDARVLDGQPLLNEAAVTAVKQWKYSPTFLNGKAIPVTATVTIQFTLTGDKAESGITGSIGAGVGSGSGAGVGSGSGAGMGSGIEGGIGGGAGGAIRVGSKVMESKLVREVEPVYPSLAKRARVQGPVILQVTVDERGIVTNVRVLDGHPLLNEAAVTAVKQWQYSPTMMNGKAVPVMATVTVSFALKGE